MNQCRAAWLDSQRSRSDEKNRKRCRRMNCNCSKRNTGKIGAPIQGSTNTRRTQQNVDLGDGCRCCRHHTNTTLAAINNESTDSNQTALIPNSGVEKSPYAQPDQLAGLGNNFPGRNDKLRETPSLQSALMLQRNTTNSCG